MRKADELARCPCGSTPSALNVAGEFTSPKYATVCGNCCGEWQIEFRNGHTEIGGPDSTAKATKAWNDAIRAPELREMAGE